MVRVVPSAHGSLLVCFYHPQRFAEREIFGELQSTLQSAISLCETFVDKGWFKKAFQGKSDESKFESIVVRLDKAIADLQLDLQLDGACRGVSFLDLSALRTPHSRSPTCSRCADACSTAAHLPV
jgi:hypothetical protein